ncbi:MAG TPA: hypothetical protein DCO83_09450 [Mucilaginibacter sp.]|nr:hypothetical protein [Mucilaginibacter sp.]
MKQVITWHERGDIVVFCCETLKKEWEKHRENELKSIELILKKHQKDLKISKLFEKAPDIGDAELTAADKLLKSQIEAIDKLLAECRQVRDEKPAASRMWEHRGQRKAPFHLKITSDNDAVILFSVLDEIAKGGDQELTFLSTNHTDYAAPGDKLHIHPDISAPYTTININYYSSLAEAIKGLIELGLPSGKQLVKRNKDVKELIIIDRKATIVSQLTSYLEKRFSDIRFLPKKLFCLHSPFIIAPAYDPRERPFTLTTDNQELYDLFSGLATQSTQLLGSGTTTQEDESKDVRDILQLLRGNLVHSISFKDGRALELPFIRGTDCTCEICTYRTLNFSEAFNKVNNLPAAGKPTLKIAYAYYLLGKMNPAIATLKQVAAEAQESRKWLTFYIAKYNLTLLAKLVKFGIAPAERDENLISELLAVPLDDVLTISTTESLADILEYLKEGNFMDKAREKIKDLVARIKDDQIDQNTGWTDNTRALLDVYFETIYFIEENYIMVDNFYEVSRITEYFTDGLFASYASRKNLGGKLLHFTDAIVESLIAFGKQDDILKFRSRYKVKVAKYESENGQRAFINQFLNLVDSYLPAVEHYMNQGGEGHQTFWPKYRRMFHNSLAMAGILEVSLEDVQAIANRLLPFLNVEKHFQAYEMSKSLSYFIRNNAYMLETRHLEGFLKYAFGPHSMDQEELILTIYNISRSSKLNLQIDTEQWEQLQATYLINENLSKGQGTVNDICMLYEVLPEKERKDEIAKFLTYNLKTNFNGQIYYWAVVNDIIKPSTRMTIKYEAEMIELASKGCQPRIFESGFYKDHRIDEFINFSFRYKKPLSPALVSEIIKLDEYYRWISDIENFNYDHFDPDWLFAHLTTYYKSKFGQSKALKDWLRKHTFNSNDPRMGQLYIQIYTKASKVS